MQDVAELLASVKWTTIESREELDGAARDVSLGIFAQWLRGEEVAEEILQHGKPARKWEEQSPAEFEIVEFRRRLPNSPR